MTTAPVIRRDLLLTVTAHAVAALSAFVAVKVAEAHYPQISPIPDIQTGINKPCPLTRFNVSDRETRADDLQVSASSDNQQLVPNGNIELGGNGQTRWIVVTPAADEQGFATITVTLTDGDGDQAQEPFRVIVRPPANQ